MITSENTPSYQSILSILRRSTELLTDDPIKEEIFSVERLEIYAGHLATELKIGSEKKRGRSLLPEMVECQKKLHTAYITLGSAFRKKKAFSPAAEWFLDNFHIIEEQIVGIKRDLPPGFYRELPKLSEGELAGYPRVYAIALALITHTDSRLDIESIRRFLIAYQQITPLQIGELWAIAITLKIALIEHLTPLALRIVSARERREQADALADHLLENATQPHIKANDLVQSLSNELGDPKTFDRTFIVQLTQRLRDQDPAFGPVFDWLDLQLKTHHQTSTLQVTLLEHHRQAAAQVTVGNIITSMRLLSALDWREFFESVSTIDKILGKDPSEIYSKMDFLTRDQYRHSIEKIAKKSKSSEVEVAIKAVALASESKVEKSDDGRRAHVGYYLIGAGTRIVEKHFKYRPGIIEFFSRLILSHPTCFYLGSLVTITTLVMIPLMQYFQETGASTLFSIFFGALAIIPVSEFSISLLNQYITTLMKPKLLPKMDTIKGLPETAKTFVVIPTLLTSHKTIRDLLKRLEIHYLGNSDPNIFFALLGDFSDSSTENKPEDTSFLDFAQKEIDELNRQYPSTDAGPHFFLFHRRRQWNSSEDKWIGWERKRGKLLEFNQLLRGSKKTSYLPHRADLEFLSKIKYVITLDSDTQLPRDCAHRLIGTIIHPLNQPHYCPIKKRVTEGYGILQPRISVDLESAARARFAKIFSGNTGLDPYTTAVSDVYQDLFSEGSFTGKGLYVVDAFEEALANRGPENSVLSHDLFEGSYARAALVTDIELFDDYPSDYDTFSKRLHRWTRGDWQIAPWLFPWVPDALGNSVPNNLSAISRWKIFDNLRRSLVVPTLFCILLLAWTVLPGSPIRWTLFSLIIIGFPIYEPLISGSIFNLHGLPWSSHLKIGIKETFLKIEQITLVVTFLASQALNQTDAICRTLYRKAISKKNLLEWITFSQTQSKEIKTFSNIEMIGFNSVFTLGLFITIAILRPTALLPASPFLLLWFFNPYLKHWLRLKADKSFHPLGLDEIQSYRNYARLTWKFFETFVTESDHWLAPDNFQEDPQAIIAHRTSPTNIGLQLLSTISAYDFGYLGLIEFVELIERIFITLKSLEKQEGHFFNWYDTITLEPLHPKYISTVDSGNLAAHLIALKQTCIELSQKAPINSNSRAGLKDTLLLVSAKAKNTGRFIPTSDSVSLSHFQIAIDACIDTVNTNPWELIEARLIEVDDLLNSLSSAPHSNSLKGTRDELTSALRQISQVQRDLNEMNTDHLHSRLISIANQCDEMMLDMKFGFLFNSDRKVFSIGYNAFEGKFDDSYYDLLASEARLASFMAIAKGDVPEAHWFRLGRLMTIVDGARTLVAWSATMFEYLMPLLVMRRYEDTLLDQTYKTVVSRQIKYGRQHSVPWGISESGYNARDLNLNYQYGPFGIPGLGLKRGLSDDLVISPYSTMLAAVIDPWASLSNLRTLEKNGALGHYGFYESIDYTPVRLPENKKSFIIKSFMAHHQGMSLVSINNLIHKSIMQKRFHAESRIQATQLLLQERIPKAAVSLQPRADEVHSSGTFSFSSVSNPRFYSDVHVKTPRAQILSNGTYSVMITSAGSGYSRCAGLTINRWREDWTQDHWGQFFYIRDRETNKYWSAGYQPTLSEPNKYEMIFAEDKVELIREDNNIISRVEIIVSPEDNVELRNLTLTNSSDDIRELEVTSFMETVLAGQNDDIAHPAFSNLFIQTEYLHNESALLATRRKRSKNEKTIWGFHGVIVDSEMISPVQYETDRSRFFGRGHGPSDPLSVTEGRPLSNTVGSVLDPVFSLRVTVKIPAHSSIRILYSTGVTVSKEKALALVDKYHDIHIFAREAEIAWTQSQVQLRHLNIAADYAHTFQRLAGRMIFSDLSLRPRPHVLATNTQKQSNLWAYGISGDFPILLAQISDEKDIGTIRELLHAHEYFRLKGLTTDLVILNERPTGYMQFLQEALQRQIRMSGSQALLDKPGGIFIRRTDIMPKADVILLKSIARVAINAENGTLKEQLMRRSLEVSVPELFQATSRKRQYSAQSPPGPPLQFFNGLGGFSPDGQTYCITLREQQWTPAPWINVIANGHDFGFQVSESGSGFTWSSNSRENRLSAWSNDPVTDPVSEAFYIRDEETGEFWSPTPLPIRESEPYFIKHGQGYTEFEHTSHGISLSLLLFVPIDAPIKVCRLRIKNLTSQTRKLSATFFVEWVLGSQRSASAPTIITEMDSETGALVARNPYNNEFADKIAFVNSSERKRTFTCDRREFLGRNGSPSRPQALLKTHLSGHYGAGLDPCAAIQAPFELGPDKEREICFTLGEADSPQEAKGLFTKFLKKEAVEAAFQQVLQQWNKTLNTIEIKTPDTAMNALVNRWLIYQTLSCRLWARSAFYQSGGAFGFRDQLQDSMAMVYSKPDLARAQILLSAARQFQEGDVQHWWHPPSGRGVRTHFSDDLLWLPFVVSFYIKTTGDDSILSEVIPFIDGPLLADRQDDSYFLPTLSENKASLFDHCARAIDRSLGTGAHGLPLMGTGDWNDGMNRVGNEGLGESVWMAWFLASTLKQFIPVCEKFGQAEKVPHYRDHILKLQAAVEEHGWDGDWYRRAYFDNGQTLGSALNSECKIDSIAQSWAILSGAGNPERSLKAMTAVDQYLVMRGDGLIKLFTPPFDQGDMDPGYIKGYVPGVRENGGQYTHAAIWTVMAYAALGDGERATELFSLLNPINHSTTRAGVHKYKVEPYVMAADVYGFNPHMGRGGWTWYTGSSSWMYRAALESILGFDLNGNTLKINPCIPKEWPEFEMIYRFKTTEYHIKVQQKSTGTSNAHKMTYFDGKLLDTDVIPVVGDGEKHKIIIQL